MKARFNLCYASTAHHLFDQKNLPIPCQDNLNQQTGVATRVGAWCLRTVKVMLAGSECFCNVDSLIQMKKYKWLLACGI
jgi:hypothetical protein